MKAICAMLVDMNTRYCDSEWYSWGRMTLNVKIQKDGDKVPERTMYNGSECQTKERWWHRMPEWAWKMALKAKAKKRWWLKIHEWVWKTALNAKLRKIVNQNAWKGTKDGSERQGWRKNANGCGCGYEGSEYQTDWTLKCKCGSERQMGNEWWPWTLTESTTLNAEWNNGSEPQTKRWWWLWTPNWK